MFGALPDASAGAMRIALWVRTMAAMEGDDVVHETDLPVPSFQSQVAFWFSVWSADRPELVEQARATANPERDPWGYLAALGELLAAAA